MAVATSRKRQRTSLLILNVEGRGKYIPSPHSTVVENTFLIHYLIASFARLVALKEA
jgi:hypothetical protein